MSDIILELFRIIPALIIFVFLFTQGMHLENKKSGWSFIILGFGLLLFATVIDFTDNFESLNKYIIVGDTATQAFLEKVVGYLGGFVFLSVGFIKWLPKIIQLDATKKELEVSEKKLRSLNKKLEKKVLERTKDLDKRNKDLEKINKITTDRELKMIELKREIQKLKKIKK